MHLPCSLPLLLVFSGLVWASPNPVASSASPDWSRDTSTLLDEPGYQPYLAFPPSSAPFGSAFSPNSSSSSPDPSPHPLLAGIRARSYPSSPSRPIPPSQSQPPEQAYLRHPLYRPGPLSAEEQEAAFKTEQFAHDLKGNVTRTRERGLAWSKVQPGKRDVVSDVPVDFPPSAWFDINDLSTLALLSQAAVARMQTWYEDGVFEWTGWWQTPVLGIAYANLDLALGNRVNELLIKDLLIKNDDLGWMIDKYIDDQSWWALFALRAHQAYPNSTWLSMVETISNNNTLYWSDTCGGGVVWLTYRPLIKNTITNGLYFSILTRLYRFTGNSTHFDYAMNTLNWWLQWGFEPSSGRVHDTITATWDGQDMSSCTVTGEMDWTYNSGAFLFGLADLYYATGDERVLDLGRSMAYAAMRDYTPDEETGILVEHCEDLPPPEAGKPPACQQDETIFKGILMLGMAELYVARPDPNIYNYINTQLLSNVFNNVDDSWLFGMWWGGPWNETTAGPKTQLNFLCLLSAAATINADFLSRTSPGSKNATAGNHTDQIAVPDSTGSADGAGTTLRGQGGANGARRVGRGEGWGGGAGGVAGLAALGLAVGAGLAVVW
ncbi:hypothetical protein JCM11251_005677 [Rhodosporidiobolus azoricus]